MAAGGDSHQRKMAKKQQERIANEVASRVLQKIGTTSTTTGESATIAKKATLTRSSIEAYVFFILGGGYAALTAFGVPVNFYVGCVLSSAVAFCATHLLWRSPWTAEWNRPSKGGGTIMLLTGTVCLINQGYLITRHRPTNSNQTASAISNLAGALGELRQSIQGQLKKQLAPGANGPPHHTHVSYVPAAGNRNPQLHGGEEPSVPMVFKNIGDFPVEEPRDSGLLKITPTSGMEKAFQNFYGALQFKGPSGVLQPHTSYGAYHDIIGERLTTEDASRLNSSVAALCGIGAVRWKDDTGRYETRFFQCLLRDPHDGIFTWHSMAENDTEHKLH